MKRQLDSLFGECTPLHLSALRRVELRRAMFGAPAGDRATLWDNMTVARELHEWRLVAGKGDGLYLTNLGRDVLALANRKELRRA